MNLGELIVELCADTAQLEKSLEQAKKKAYEAAASIEKSFDKINLEINVDDDSLTDLNKHLNLKVQHLKEVNKYFNNNPIVVNVDDDQLVDLNKHLHTKVQHLKEVNKYFNSNPITVNTDVTKLDELEQRLGNLSSKTITITVESDLSKQLEKSLTDAVQSAVRDAVSEQSASSQQQSQKEGTQSNRPQKVDVVASPMRSIVDGLFEGVGKKLTKGLDRSIEDAVGVNMDTMTRISSNMLLRYFGVGKKAQSDPKNEQKKVEAIVKDGITAFIKTHDNRATSIVDSGNAATTRSRKTRRVQPLDDDIGVDFQSLNENASRGVLRYFGVGKRAQSDPKDQRAKIEAIVKDIVADYSGSTRQSNAPNVITQTLTGIGNSFLNGVDQTVENIAQRAKVATVKAIRQSSQNVLANAPDNVQSTANVLFDNLEGKTPGKFTEVAGKQLFSVAKKSAGDLFKTILPNTSTVVKDFLNTGTTSAKTATPVVKSSSDVLKEAAADLKNAAKALSDASIGMRSESQAVSKTKAAKPPVAETTPDNSTPLPKQLPVKENKVPLPPPAKKRELEPIPVNIPEQIKPLFQTIQSEIVKNIDISQGYKDATAAENKLTPLPPVSSTKTSTTKKYAQTSLEEIDKALTSIKSYFADEYKRIQAKVKQATVVGTQDELKSARAEVVNFISRSKEAVATVDRFVKTGEDAGFSKDINSELSAIHSRGKAPIARNVSGAEKLEGKLNLADKKLFDQQLKSYTALAQQHGVEIPKGLQNGIKHGAGGVSDATRTMLDDLIKTVETRMGISSPSKVMIALGVMIASGLAIGIKQGVVDVSGASQSLTNVVYDIQYKVDEALALVYISLPEKLRNIIDSLSSGYGAVVSKVIQTTTNAINSGIEKYKPIKQLFDRSLGQDPSNVAVGLFQALQKDLGKDSVIPEKLNNLKKAITEKINSIRQLFLSTPIGQSVEKFFGSLSGKLNSFDQSVTTKLKSFFEGGGNTFDISKYLTGFTNLKGLTSIINIKDIGINLITSFGQGFLSASTGVFGIVTRFTTGILSIIKRIFGIASPSKVMQSIGLDFGEGFENGAVASLVLANKRIADLILKTVNESTTATESQKAKAASLSSLIDTQNQKIAQGFKEGTYNDSNTSDVLKELALGTKTVKRVAKSSGVAESEIPSILQQSRREVNSLPKAYTDILKAVAQITGVSINSKNAPKLVPTTFERESIAGSYSASKNTIKVSEASFQELTNKKLSEVSDDLISTVVHELFHGVQQGFGTISKDIASTIQADASLAEIAKMSPNIEHSVAAVRKQTRDPSLVAISRGLETGAYVFEDRYASMIKNQPLQQLPKLSNLGTSNSPEKIRQAILDFGKSYRDLWQEGSAMAKTLEKMGIDSTESKTIIKSITKYKDELVELAAKLDKAGNLPPEEIDQAVNEIKHIESKLGLVRTAFKSKVATSLDEFSAPNTIAPVTNSINPLIQSEPQISESTEQTSTQQDTVAQPKSNSFFDTIKHAVLKGNNLKEIGINLITAFGQGFLSANGGVLGLVTKFATGVLTTIKKIFRIASPSGEGIDVGENIASSTGTGIDNNAHVAVDAARRMAESVNNVLHETLILTPGQSKGTTGSLILPNTTNLRTRELILPANYQRPQSQRIGLDTLPLDRLFRPVIQKLTQPEARSATVPVLRSSVPINSLAPQIEFNVPNNLDQVVQQQIKTLAASVVSLQQNKSRLPIDYTGPLILPTSVKPELQNLSILPAKQSNPYSGEIITSHATARVRQPELILPQNYLRSQSQAIGLNTLPIDRLFRPLIQKLTRLNEQLPSTAVLRSNLPTTNSNIFTRPVFPNNIQEALATPPRTRVYNGQLILPNSARPDLQNLNILPAIQSNPYTGSILTPNPLSRYRPIITAPNQPIANPDANLILPNQPSSTVQRLILPRSVTRPSIRINLDALTSGNMSQLFNRYPQIPDPWTTAPRPVPLIPPIPRRPVPPVPPVSQSRPKRPTVNLNSPLPNQPAPNYVACYACGTDNVPNYVNCVACGTPNPAVSQPSSTTPLVSPLNTSTRSQSPRSSRKKGMFVGMTDLFQNLHRAISPVLPARFQANDAEFYRQLHSSNTGATIQQEALSNVRREISSVLPSNVTSHYLGLGKDLITNLFTAVSDSVRQSTLSGYASLGQVMRNAVNAALFSLADTLKQPLYQGLLSQSRSIMPWFMKFIPRTLQLVPMLKPLIPVLGGLTLGLGNAIIKNLLNNDVLKPGGFLTKLLSSITRIDLSSLSGQKAHGILGGISRMLNPIPSMLPLPPVAGVGIGGSMLGMFGMFMNMYGGILGLDQSSRSNPRNQAPTVEKVLQEQTAANRKKAGLGNAKGTQASQQLIENLGNTAIDSVLENLNIPMIPTSVIQGFTGNKLKQQSGSIAGVLNSLGLERSRAEQLLEKTVKSGRTNVGRRTDILTKQVLRERGVTQQQRDSMTPKELEAARENILKAPLDITKRERELLRFLGDMDTHEANMGVDAARRKRDKLIIPILTERGMSRKQISIMRQSNNGQYFDDVSNNLRSNLRTGSFVGKLTEAYASNDQEAMKGLLLEGLKKAGISSQQLKNIDPKLLDTATAGLMASLTGLQAKFKEKGFDMGKSIAQGFKDSVRNLANAKDDLEYNAKKALGQANFGDALGVIFKRMSRGTVATQDQFKEMYNQMGSGVKKALFSNSKEADETFPNVLQFMGSIAATLAPVTSLFASLSPLFLPLAPIIGGIGAAVSMVSPHVARLMDGIQRVEVLQRRFTFLGGSKAGGETEFKYAKDIANKMNVPSEVAANSYSQLAIAAKDSKMEGQGVKDLFEGITASLSALGITGQDASLVFMAYTQILAKGKLSMEELRQQLGEKFPPAMGVFAKAMGMSVPEMTALISSGGVLSHDILPKVAKVLNQDYGNSAAKQAGGLVVALNKLGNVGFEITTIFTDKLGGTLGFFVSTFADGLSLFSKSLGALIPLGQSFAIGFAATIGIGLTVIMTKFKPLVTLLGSLQNLLMATFSVVATNMMPMIIGVTADVADNWLGAEKDMIANMKDGITNMVVATFSTIDSVMRSMSDGNVSFSSMFGSLVQGAEQAGNMIDWLKGVFSGFFKVIPPGFIELLAMVFMFEQGTGLAVMALTPAFKGFFGALTGMLGGAAKAFVGVMTSMKVASELMMTSMSAAITASEARIKIFSATLGFLKTALTHIGVAFAILMFSKGDFSNPMGESLKEATKELNNGLTEIRANVQKTADSFDKATNNVKKLGGSLADTLPSKGVQLDIRSFWGGGDFKWDDAIKARNKGEASPVMDFLGVSALGVAGAGLGFAASFGSIGTITTAVLGLLSPVIGAFAPVVLAVAGFVAAITLATKALDLFAPKLTDKQKEFLNKPENKGIKSYFDTEDPNARLTNAQQQVLQYFEDQEKNIQNLKEFAASQGFTGKPSDFVADIRPLTIDQQQKFNANPDISNLNKQIEDNNNRRLAVLADAKARGASPQEIKDIQNSTDFKNLENQSKEMRNAVALAAADFQIGESPENKKNLADIDKQIAKKQAELKQIERQSKENARARSFSAGLVGDFAPTYVAPSTVIGDPDKLQKEIQDLEAKKDNTSNVIKASIQRAFDFKEIKNIDKQLEAATKRSVELNKALPSDKVRKEQGDVKQLIQQLYKKREDLVNSFGSPLPIFERMLKQEEEYKQKLQLGAVEGVKGQMIPAAVQKTQARIDQLKTMIAGAKPFDVRPMEEALYTQATNAVKDANIRFERATSANRVESNLSQAKIYASSGTSQQIAPELARRQLEDLGSQRSLLTEKINSDQVALDKISQVIAAGGTNLNEAQAEFDKLQADIIKDKESLSQNTLETIKAQRDMRQALIDQTKQVAEYYRTSVREAQAAGIEFEKASNTLKNQQNASKLKQAILGTGNNIFSNFVDGLIGILQQVTDIQNTELDKTKQKIDYQNNLDDINLRVSELQRSLPGKIIPFDANKIKDFDDQLKTVQGSVVGINSNVQSVVQSLGQDAVIATNTLNDAFLGLGDTITGVGTRLDAAIDKLNQANTTTGSAFDGLTVQTNQSSTDWASNALNVLNQLDNATPSVLAAIPSVAVPTPSRATTPAPTPSPTVTPTVATQFASPIKNTTIQDLINYKPTFGQSVMGNRPKGRIHNKVDFDSRVKGGAGAEIIASLAGVAKLQKWGGQDAAVFVNSILPSGTQITIEYGHLALNSIKNTLGDLGKPVQVQAGQKLGNVLGHHLDFGVRANGRYINPQVFLANLAKGDYGAIASQPPATAKTKANTVTPASQSKGESVIRMQRLGQKDEFGLEKIQLAVIKQGKLIDSFIVNSGKADTQIFGGAGETKAGSKQPVEFGSYKLGKTTPSGNKAKMGNEFIRLEPDFKTERTAIGFHIDKDRLVDPGSSGCIVFANEAEFNKFKQALKSTGIKSFVFDQAVGAVEIAKNVASQVKPLPQKSGNRAFDASNIVSKNKLQSLVVQELSTGRLLGSINSNVSPVSSASTVKLIVADLITDAINQGTATLQETLTIKPGEVAQWSAINKAGQKRKISELLTQMIVKSDNTAANVLINRLGGLDKLNQLAAAKGYANTKFNKYFLLPGEDTKKGNVSTAGDVTSAARELLVTNSPSDKLAADALKTTRNFKYQGEVGGKIGNNSKIIGNVGVVNINGKLYLVTAFANTNGNELTNRKFITNATNDVVKQIQGIQSSIPRAVTQQVKPLPQRQAVMSGNLRITQGGNDLSPEEYAKLTPLGKELYELRRNKYILALGSAVANAEGSDFRKNTRNFGYGLTIGGENVTDFSKHPYVGTGRKPTWIKAINNASTASGRYQMMNFNASIQAAKKQFGKNAMPDMFKLTDYQGQDQPSFSPGMQDLYFIHSLKSRGVLDQVLAGQVDPSVLNKLALHYASIQSGKNRSAYKGQGTPHGRHGNFLKSYEENLKVLSSAQMSGSSIDPNALQGAFVDGGTLSAITAKTRYETQRLTTEAQQQLKIQNVESSINKLFLDTKKAIRLAEINITESRLNTQSFILDNRFGVSPAQRIPLELERFDLDMAKRANELQDIIDETSGVTLESIKIKVAPMLEEAAKLGITFDPQQLEEYYQKTFQMNQKRLEASKKLLKDLLLAQPDLRKDKETFLNNQEEVRTTGIGLQTEKLQVGLLQKQIEQRKLLQQLNPLDPRSARTADLEANLALKNADVDYREKLNSILSEEGKSLSVEEAQRRRNLAKEEFELNKQNIELKRRSDNITEDSAMPSKLLERVQFIQDSFKGVQESRSSLLKAYGLDFRAEKIDRELAITNLQMDFAKANLQLDDFIRKNAEATEANKLTNEQIETLRKNLKLTNEAKLDAIKLQFSELGTVVKGVTGGFRSGFKEFLLSTKGFGESIGDLFNSIFKGLLDPLADIASKRVTDALFGWTEGLFGNKKQPTDGINAVKGLTDLSMGANGLNLAGMTLNQAGQMLMNAALTLSSQTVANTAMDAGGNIFGDLLGGVFDVLSGSVFNANSMGFNPTPGLFDAIPTDFGVATLPIFASGGIVGALNKERSLTGRTPHLIVASEGERVLNHRETAIWNKLQSGVAGFANGGVVGAGGNGSIASRIGNTTTINVPVNVEVGGNSEVDTYRLSQAVQAMVSDGIRREMRVGGSINRGNPYGR